MNSFPKNLGKHKKKQFKQIKTCSNPPKKNILKPKPLLIPISKKIIKRKFGNEIQNLKHLTEENHLLFNKKKRRRRKKEFILKLDKRNNNINEISIKENNKEQKNKIFNIIHLSHNKINKNNNDFKNKFSLAEYELQNENNNQNVCKENMIMPNKEIKEENEKMNNFKEIKVIKKNINKNEINEKCDDNKIIKVSIIGIRPENNILNKNIININKRFELQNAKEYLDEIYFHLRSIEKKDLPLENYMALKQTDINEKMRIILINWLIEVHFKFHLLSETLYICINIIDRYLSKKNINRKYLQLLGVTSLFIACKYEEIYSPTSKDLIFMTDNAYKKEEMIQMESDILNIIHFDLTYPTSFRFLEIYKHYLDLDEINFYRCSYLNEISLINYNLCSFNPSLIACVSLYLNLKSNILYFKGYNEEQLFNITGYKKIDIKNCLNRLIKAVIKIEEPDNKFIAIKKKYSLDKYMKVSNDSYLIKEDIKDNGEIVSKGSVFDFNIFDNMVID